MRQLWSKAQTLVKPAELEVHRNLWQSAGWNMPAAFETYERALQDLRSVEQSSPVLNSLEVPQPTLTLPNCTSSTCPHVASVLHSLDAEALDWLTTTYLWGDVARYGSSSDGYTRQQQDKVCTAAEKLEQLISETHARRVAHCDSPAEDILVGLVLYSLAPAILSVNIPLYSHAKCCTA